MKNKRIVKITAGRLQRLVLYTQASARDEPKARAAKSRISSEARTRINQRTSWEKLEELLAANFDGDDLFLTLTYREAPPTREYALRQLNAFLRLLREQRRNRGQELVYVKNAEHIRDDGSEGRWHHHLIINATGHDYEEIRSLWAAWGDNVDFEKLLCPGESYEARAKYLCKEKAPAGKQTWTPCRGLRRPQRSSELVDDAFTIDNNSLPRGAVILEKKEEINQWGTFIYFKYLLPRPAPPARGRVRGDGGPL